MSGGLKIGTAALYTSSEDEGPENRHIQTDSFFQSEKMEDENLRQVRDDIDKANREL